MTKKQKKEYMKIYRQKNHDKILKQVKAYQKKHKKEIQKYRDEHKQEKSIYQKKYHLEHKQEDNEYQKIYSQTHKKELSMYRKKYKKEHREDRNKKRKIKRDTDINYKLREYLRSRIWNVLKHNTKSGHIEELIGISIEQLKLHLENQFTKGMSWSNYGKWHIDHIRPCASFDLSEAEEQLKCFNYKNLQPLWAVDNLSKGAK